MIDLTKLTAEELMRGKTEADPYVWLSGETIGEIRRRLERLEKCEAENRRLKEQIAWDRRAALEEK